MPVIKSSIQLSINGGPSWIIAHNQDVDAYDVVDVTIDPNTTDKTVQIQPGDTSQVALFAIQSSLYGSEISFKASDGATDTASVPLLGPHLYGSGNVTLFTVPPQILKFSNSHPAADATKKARIQILIGRTATT